MAAFILGWLHGEQRGQAKDVAFCGPLCILTFDSFVNRRGIKTEYVGNVISSCAMIEPKQTPITPNRRVRRIERARLHTPTVTARTVCSFRTPAPVRRLKVTTETVLATYPSAVVL